MPNSELNAKQEITRYREGVHTVFATESTASIATTDSLLSGPTVSAPSAIALVGMAGLAHGHRRRG